MILLHARVKTEVEHELTFITTEDTIFEAVKELGSWVGHKQQFERDLLLVLLHATDIGQQVNKTPFLELGAIDLEAELREMVRTHRSWY